MKYADSVTAFFVIAALILSGATIYYIYKTKKSIPSAPEQCKGISCKRIFSSGGDPTFDWIVSWTPPSTGTGTGYAVTYSGSVAMGSNTPVYTFTDITNPGFALPGTTPPGQYTVNVTAKNQVGTGPEYSGTITITNHAPQITQNVLSYGNVGLGQILQVVATGTFPDWSGKNTPPNYYVSSYSLYDGNGNQLQCTLQQIQGDGSKTVTISFSGAWNFQRGDKITLKYTLNNYQLSTSQTVGLSFQGVAPGESSGVSAKFRG